MIKENSVIVATARVMRLSCYRRPAKATRFCRAAIKNISGYTDKYIFLPAAGYRGGTSLSDAGSSGDYWSSSLDTSLFSGRHLYFNSSDVNLCGSSRYFGYTVRSVCPPELTYVGARRELSRDALPCVSTFVC